MNREEKIISAFRQDVRLPAIVTEKAETAFDTILSKDRGETGDMKESRKESRVKEQTIHREQEQERAPKESRQSREERGAGKSGKKKVPAWAKITAAAAAFLLLVAGVCTANPVLAAKIPVIGRIFTMLEKTAEYPGDYKEYAQPLEDTQPASLKEQPAEAGEEANAYSQTAGGVSVTLSEVYCNQESISISMLVESEEAFADQIVKYVDGSQQLILDGNSVFSFNPQPYVGSNTLVGTFLDDKTFAGIWRIELSEVLTDYSEIIKQGLEFDATDPEVMQHVRKLTLPDTFTMEVNLEKIIGNLAEPVAIDWGISEQELEKMSDEEFQALYHQKEEEYGLNQYPNKTEHVWFEGPWNFSIPVQVNKEGSQTVVINDTNESGLGLESISVTPFELSIKIKDPEEIALAVVFDEEGKWMDFGTGSMGTIPVDGHKIGHLTVYLCHVEAWLNEIKGHWQEADFQQYVEKNALYQKEVNLSGDEK